MRKKSLVFIVLALTLSITTSGCIDLFHVPGVAVSPDGSHIYFLAGDSEGQASGQLVSAPLGGAIDTTIFAGNEDDSATAFDVNPTTGEVAFIRAGKTTGGTTLEIYNPADGSTRTVLGTDAFGVIGLGTMLQYSPDGSHIAFTLLALPPDVTPDSLNADDSELTDEQLAAITYRAFIVNVADGGLTEIVGSVPTAFNTFAWNPAGTALALNGWTDANGDGKIVIFPTDDPESGETGDSTNIYIYDIAANSLQQVSEGTFNYAPTYIQDVLVWASADLVTEQVSIMTSEGSPYSTPNTITGIAPSPDGSKVAWTETQDSGDSEDQQPGLVYVAEGLFANPVLLAELPNNSLPDVPVWTPDGQSLLVGSTSVLASMVTSFTASFSVSIDMGTESTPEASGDATTTAALPSVVQINATTGEITTIYEGAIINSSFYTGIVGLLASGALDEMFSSMDTSQ